MIVRVNVVLNRTLLTVTDISTTYALVIFRVKVSCITSFDSIKLWFIIFKFRSLRILILGLWKLNGFVSRDEAFDRAQSSLSGRSSG